MIRAVSRASGNTKKRLAGYRLRQDNHMNRKVVMSKLFRRSVAVFGFAVLAVSASLAADISKSVAGTIEKVDAEARIIYVRTKDGAVKAYKWTKSSTAHGIRSAEVWSARAVHKGAHVVIRTVEVAGEDTIKGLHWFGHGTLKVADAVFHFAEKNGKKVTATVIGDSKKVYDVSRHVVLNTGDKIVHGFKDFGKHTGKEVKVVIYTVEKDGKAVINHIEHLDD